MLLLYYLLRQEDKGDAEALKANFEMSVFANDPELYHKMFAEEKAKVEKEDIDWVRPDSAEDVAAVMEKLKSAP